MVRRERARWNPDNWEHVWRNRTNPTHSVHLNADQQHAFDVIRAAIDDYLDPDSPPRARFFYVDGLGGCGKTFLYNTVLAYVRSRTAGNQVAIPVASSGIAALLLAGGRTAHSRFKIPIKLNETSTCHISAQHGLAAFVRAAALAMWDEVGMVHRYAVEALDRTFRDLMSQEDPRCEHVPFGGKPMLLGGDFRQIATVIPKGSRGQIVNASVKRSRLWEHVQVLQLHTNMRVQRLTAAGQDATELQWWADWLRKVGEGTERVADSSLFPELGDSLIEIPEQIRCDSENIEDLIREVYGGMAALHGHPSRLRGYLLERAILTSCNEEVDAINAKVMRDFRVPDGPLPDGEVKERVYCSADTVEEQEMSNAYTTEYLNTLLPSGIPPHELRLKVGCPIMLLRNLPGGLANGSRLIVTRLMQYFVEAEMVDAEGAGNRQPRRVMIPRLDLIPSDDTLFPFTLKRRQFPVRPAFAMTINKSQGQTLTMMGLYLSKSVFSHGQLYVALSRVGSHRGVRVMVVGGKKLARRGGLHARRVFTTNVVFRELFQG
jgi:ATP-dependent DNA helicase PIF1